MAPGVLLSCSSISASILLVLVPLLLVNQPPVTAEEFSAIAAQTASLESFRIPQEEQIVAPRFSRSLLQRKKGMHGKGKGMHKERPDGRKRGGHVLKKLATEEVKPSIQATETVKPSIPGGGGGAWDLRDLENGPLRHTTEAHSFTTADDGTLYLRLTPGQVVGGKLRSVNKYQYGHFEFKAKTPAKNSGGIISTVYLSTMYGRHDEIDWEFKRGGSLSRLQTNWFACGKGTNEYEPDLWFKAYEDFHTYTIEWTADKIEFYVDGKLVQTVYNKGQCFPTEPMFFQMAIWHASWAGDVDWGQDREHEFAIKDIIIKPLKTFVPEQDTFN